MIKSIFGGAAILFGAYWLMGLSGDGYSRDVNRPPAVVMAALADLDIREAPGSPATDPSRSGGVKPLISLERAGTDGMSWIVMSGDKLAVRLTANFAPLDDGRRTRVTAAVERGDAPDDFVSPAFRSKGLTMALFSGVLESELDELTAPPPNPAACAELFARLDAGALGSVDQMHQDSLRDAVGDTMTTVMKLSAYDAALRRNGCSPGDGNDFQPVKNTMGTARSHQRARDGVSFEAGKPMVDVSAGSSR
jgi:hypothetical protein